MTDRSDAGATDSRVAVVLGTRPEIVKLGGIIRLLGRRAVVVHTGQHFNPAMSDRVLGEMRLPPRWADLAIGGQSRGGQLGAAVTALDRLIADRRPHVLLVQGDTTSALAGALAANANEVPLVHVEAGLRSFDRRMPEEHNRVLIDQLADVCCAPTEANRQNLLAERVDDRRIAVTGNTVVEAVQAALPAPAARRALVRRVGLDPRGFVLATLHRPENVDEPQALRTILTTLSRLPVPVLLPVHPRTAARVAEFGLEGLLQRLCTIGPLNHPDLLAVAKEAALLVTDSGGLQEEVSVLKQPAVVVRRSTERPEIEGTFGVRVAPGSALEGTVHEWLHDAERRRAVLAGTASPYGDGSASRLVVDLVDRLLAGPSGYGEPGLWPISVPRAGVS